MLRSRKGVSTEAVNMSNFNISKGQEEFFSQGKHIDADMRLSCSW